MATLVARVYQMGVVRDAQGQPVLDSQDQPIPVMVETTIIFQHAAQTIRDASTTWSKPPLIMVNHDTFDRTSCTELLEDFERGGQGIYSGVDLVDIWTSAAWMPEDGFPPEPHPLTLTPYNLNDIFWWYQFDYDDASDMGAMRHAQSGLAMLDRAYSGHANYSFWSANPDVGAGAP